MLEELCNYLSLYLWSPYLRIIDKDSMMGLDLLEVVENEPVILECFVLGDEDILGFVVKRWSKWGYTEENCCLYHLHLSLFSKLEEESTYLLVAYGSILL